MLPSLTPLRREDDAARMQKACVLPPVETAAAEGQRDHPARWRAVIIANVPGDELPCPECGAAFADEARLRRHVFVCRAAHGVDPLLPLTVLHRSPRRSGGGRNNTRGDPGVCDAATRPICPGPPVAAPLFAGRTARAGASPATAPRDRSPRARTAPNAAVAMWERTIDMVSRSGAAAAAASVRSPAPPPATARGPSLRRSHGGGACSSPRRHQRPVPASARHGSRACTADPPIAPPSAGLQAALRAMLGHLRQGARDVALILDGLTVEEGDVAILHGVLAPGPATLPITTISFCGTQHATATCLREVARALRRCETLLHINVDGSDLAAVAVDETHKADDAEDRAEAKVLAVARRELAEAMQRVASRREARERAEIDEDFQGLVAEQLHHERAAAAHMWDLRGAELAARAAISDGEVAARRAMGTAMATALTRVAVRQHRLQVRAARTAAQQLLDADEQARRGEIVAAHVLGVAEAFERVEEERRILLARASDWSRLVFRFLEREAIFRCKGVEQERVQRHHVERRGAGERAELAALLLAAEHRRSLDLVKRLEQRHASQARWRERCRLEVNSFVDYADKALRGIIADAVTFWQSSCEKLARTIDGVRAKYAAQQEALRSLEASRRAEAEGAMAEWLTLVHRRCSVLGRLLLLRAKAIARGVARAALLRETPVVIIHGLDNAQPAVYCMASEGHQPPDAIPLLPGGVDCVVAMRADWQPQMAEALARCKSSVVEERAAVHEALDFAARRERRMWEVGARALESLPPVDLHALLTPSRLAAYMGISAAPPPSPPQQHPPSPIHASACEPGGGGVVAQQHVADDALTPTPSRKRSVRRRFSNPDPPPPLLEVADPNDPFFCSLRDEVLALRAAWADRATAATIRAAKERISGGVVRVCVCGEPAPRVEGATDRLCSAITTFPLLLDGEPPQLDDAPGPLSVSDILTAESVAVHRHGAEDDTVSLGDTSDDGSHSQQHDGDGGVSCRPLPAATRCVEVFLERATGGASSVSRRPTISIDVSARSHDSSAEVHPFDSRAPSRATTATTADFAVHQRDITTVLHSLLYRNVAQGGNAEELAGSGTLRRFRITVELHFELRTRYGEPEQPDAFGYAPLPPSEDFKLTTVTAACDLFVAVLPSAFALTPDKVPAVRTLIEGSIDRVDIFQHCLAGIRNPWSIEATGDASEPWRLAPPSPTRGYNGGSLRIEVTGGGAGAADRISLLEEPPTITAELQLKTVAIDAVRVHGAVVARCIGSGVLQSTASVTPVNNPNGGPPAIELTIGSSDGREVLGSALPAIIHQLRFHNFTAEPEEGERVVQVSLVAPNGARSVLEAPFDVECIDKPTELKIAHPKLTFRAAAHAIAPPLRPFLTHSYCAIAPNCLVEDEDTDRFSGGLLTVTLRGAAKGDALVLVPDVAVLYPVAAAQGKQSQLQVLDDGGVVYEGRVVATITEGQVVQDDGREPEFDAPVFSCNFAQEDACSIKAVETLLRHVALVNTTAPYSYRAHSSAQRDIDIHIQIMDNEQACTIDDSVVIKGAGHTIQVAEKGTTFDYKETMGAAKLGNFDVSNDRINPIVNFGTGFLLVTIIEGCDEDDDVIGLRTDDAEYKLIEFGERAKSKRSGTLGALGRLRAAAHEVGHQQKRPNALGDVVKDAMGAKKKKSGKQELVFTGMSAPMASVTRLQRGLLISFYADTKKDQVTRKQVSGLLRNLTYTCTSASPAHRSKVIQVLCSDHVAATPSQCVVNARIDVVDEVTEIRLKSAALQYVQQPGCTLALLPFGRALLVDDDTEHFDGGCFELFCVAGSTRGDVLQLIPPHLQLPGVMQRTETPLDSFTGAAFPTLSVDDAGGTFRLDGTTIVGIAEFGVKDGGHSSVRIMFPAADAPDQRRVSRDLASYMMNSICFGNSLEKLRDTNRQFQLRVRDADNPVEGKAKLQLAVRPPHLCFVSGPTAPFDSFFTLRRRLPAARGGVIEVCDKTTAVNLTKYNPRSTAPMHPGFVAELTGTKASSLRLVLPLASLGIEAREGGRLHLGRDFVCRLEETSPLRIALAFDGNCNTRVMNRALMLSIVRALQVSVEEPLCGAGSGGGGEAWAADGDPGFPTKSRRGSSGSSGGTSACGTPGVGGVQGEVEDERPGSARSDTRGLSVRESPLSAAPLAGATARSLAVSPHLSRASSRRSSSIRFKSPATPAFASGDEGTNSEVGTEAPHVATVALSLCDGDNVASAEVLLIAAPTPVDL